MQNEDITAGALPLIDLTPLKLVAPAVPALLRAVTASKTIAVAFSECKLVEDHAVDGETAFDMVFTITISEAGEQEPEQRTITKRVVVSNDTLAEEARLGAEGVRQVLEGKRQAAAESRRMRELAGIPHKDNFV